MKKIIILLSVICTGICLSGCGEDGLRPESVFGEVEEELTGFDLWLDQNFRAPYNIRFEYRWDDKESDISYELLPCKNEKAYQLAMMIKHVWLDAYIEVAGLDFIRMYCPRFIYLVGSSAYRTSSVVQGTAESGKKVVLYDVNALDPLNIAELNSSYFKSMHHEFAHILHQTKEYDPTFSTITANYYNSSSWMNNSSEVAAALGFVTPYASSEPDEDFAETMANYLMRSDTWWENLYEKAGETGTPLIEQKVSIVKSYMQDKWNVDLDAFRSIVQRRGQEVSLLDIDYPFDDLD